MKDIVKELRQWEGEYHYPTGLLTRAADEIEKLRLELEHSEWLRQRAGQAYARVGDDVV